MFHVSPFSELLNKQGFRVGKGLNQLAIIPVRAKAAPSLSLKDFFTEELLVRCLPPPPKSQDSQEDNLKPVTDATMFSKEYKECSQKILG